MHAQEILTAISLILASIAIGLSYFTFQKQRNVNNEDFIFQNKVKIFQQSISKISKIIMYFEDVETKLDEHKVGISILTEEQIEEIENDLDKACNQFSYTQFEDHLLLSSDISKKLEDFHNKLFDTPMDLIDDYPAFKKHLNVLYAEADRLFDAFRCDLNIEKLNYTLFNRIAGKG